jgi:hypothetical protein
MYGASTHGGTLASASVLIIGGFVVHRSIGAVGVWANNKYDGRQVHVRKVANTEKVLDTKKASDVKSALQQQQQQQQLNLGKLQAELAAAKKALLQQQQQQQLQHQAFAIKTISLQKRISLYG